jgi:hypothetical protein
MHCILAATVRLVLTRVYLLPCSTCLLGLTFMGLMIDSRYAAPAAPAINAALRSPRTFEL